MAKLILADEGARKSYIDSFKTDLTHCALMRFGSVGATMTPQNISSDCSDRVGTVKQLDISSLVTKYYSVETKLHPTDKSKTLTFETLEGIGFDRLLLLKPNGNNYDVNGVITFPNITPATQGAYAVNSIKIEVKDSE